MLVHNEFSWYEYFLNQSNHLPNIPLDMISFHFYALCSERANVSQYLSFFAQVHRVKQESLLCSRQIFSLKKPQRSLQFEISIHLTRKSILMKLVRQNNAKITLEGAILPNDNVPDPSPIPGR